MAAHDPQAQVLEAVDGALKLSIPFLTADPGRLARVRIFARFKPG